MSLILVPPPTPRMPFEGYKWRWATLTPTEGLNVSSVYVGVLRALARHEGEAASSLGLMESLRVVEYETASTVHLARNPERNLMRNSGQYWKALGVISATNPIRLTQFGHAVSNGEITLSEFSAVVIKTLTLPNTRIQDDVDVWLAHNLTIKPLELVLEILSALSVWGDNAYITSEELIKVIIPLAGARANVADYTNAILYFRRNNGNCFSDWPDCTPSANDKRMAKEFLIFLTHYGYIQESLFSDPFSGRLEKRFSLMDITPSDIYQMGSMGLFNETQITDAISNVQFSQIPDLIDRRRVTRELIARTGQYSFRQNVFRAASKRCAVTGVSLETVLQAAHIIPVSSRGSDHFSNGLCLRSDIHILYDNGLLRIYPTGEIKLAERVEAENSYATLPNRIVIPKYVNPAYLDWRNKYL